MSKRRKGGTGAYSTAPKARTAAQTTPARGRTRLYLAMAGCAIALIAALIVGFVVLGGFGSGPAGGLSSGQTIVQGNGGHWTNVTPDRLAQMLQGKDFTLLNVKTPYSSEIAGTDLYIPYDQLKVRATELPADKSARVLVYCRSGVQSAQAAQTLLDLGYTNVWNLDGGMNAWTASGRTLVNLNR
ncbi:MAG: rhodanese-like domain-containing protein [Candidatus Limnocylindrales bacterium]